MFLTKAEDMKKRWQEHKEELYKKDRHDPDNHDGVITHLEPDILECEVKRALESINSLLLSLLYGPTLTSVHDYRKTIALTIWIFVGKVIYLLFNMLSSDVRKHHYEQSKWR